MVDDAILSREAAYIYQYAIGFSPVRGNLLLWQGIVEDSAGQSAQLQIELPQNFPAQPPVMTLPGSTQHARLESNGELRTRSIQNWSTGNHVYSVIREAKSVISKGRFQSISSKEVGNQEDVLRSQVNALNSQLQMRKRDLQEIENQPVQAMTSHNLDEVIEASLLEVENESYALEDAYDNLELKAIDFAIQFVEARKRFYLIEMAKS